MARAPDIFAYLDYRAYLEAWLAYRRSEDPSYSFLTFANESGLSRSALPNILAGTRTPKASTLDGLSRGLGLGPTERNYLALLVELEASPTVNERRAVLRRITSRVAYGHKSWLEDDPSTFEQYLSRWYHVAIRELARIPGFQADAAWVARTLMPPISEEDAAEALELLMRLGLIVRNEDGVVTVPEIRLESREDVHGEVMLRYHEEVVPLVLGQLRHVPGNQRNFVISCTQLSPDSYVEATKILWQAIERVTQIGDGDEQPGRRVYFVALQCSPVTLPQE